MKVHRRALIVGIDQYDSIKSLTGCVSDADRMLEVLEKNYDGSPNYECKILTSPSRAAGAPSITQGVLRGQLKKLFEGAQDAVLFYFSGHGCMTDTGGF